MNDTVKGKKLLKEFLDKNPEMKSNQAILRAQLAMIADPKDRLAFLMKKISANIEEMSKLTNKIDSDLVEFKKKMDKLDD